MARSARADIIGGADGAGAIQRAGIAARIAETQMKKAVAYLRVSSTAQAGQDRDGLVRQRLAIENYATDHKIEIVGWFEDDISGTTNPLERPQFAAMVTRLLENGVRSILIEKYDRLARSSMWIDWTILKLGEKKIEVVSVCESELADGKDPYKKAMRSMMSAFAQLERDVMVKKLQDARARKRLTPGYVEGRKVYGSTPEEKVVLAQILVWHSEGMSIRAIADRLNAEGAPTSESKRKVFNKKGRRASGRWYFQQVGRILKRAKP
jgi:site-specific DNA recombinase